MSVDGPPGFQLLRLGFLQIAIQSSEALGPRGYFFRRGLAARAGARRSLSLTTTVYSSMWASRSCGSLDNHPPLSYIRAPGAPPTWLNDSTRLCLYQTLANNPARI